MSEHLPGSPEARAASARRYGRWSIGLGLVALVLVLVSAVRVIAALNGPQLDDATIFSLLGAMIALMLSFGACLVGGVLAIAGIALRGPEPTVAWIGLALNVGLLIGGGWVASQLIHLRTGM